MAAAPVLVVVTAPAGAAYVDNLEAPDSAGLGPSVVHVLVVYTYV